MRLGGVLAEPREIPVEVPDDDVAAGRGGTSDDEVVDGPKAVSSMGRRGKTSLQLERASGRGLGEREPDERLEDPGEVTLVLDAVSRAVQDLERHRDAGRDLVASDAIG